MISVENLPLIDEISIRCNYNADVKVIQSGRGTAEEAERCV